METIVWEVEFNDGRIFRIFCANRKQKEAVIKSYEKIKDMCKEIRVITNGIHTTKQWGQIVGTL